MTLMILSYPLTKHPIAFLNGLKTILLKSNADRCHLLVSTNYRVSMNVDEFKIDKSDIEKLLVLNFDRKLTFDDHIPDTCKKIGRVRGQSDTIHEYCEETHTDKRFFHFTV